MNYLINKHADIVSVSSNQSSINQKGVSKMMEGLRLEQEILAKQDVILNCARAQAAKLFHFMPVEEATKEIFQSVVEKILISKPSELKAGYIKRVAETVTADICRTKPYGLHSSIDDSNFIEKEKKSFEEGYFGFLELFESLPEKIRSRMTFEDFYNFLLPRIEKKMIFSSRGITVEESRRRNQNVKYNLSTLKNGKYDDFIENLQAVIAESAVQA